MIGPKICIFVSIHMVIKHNQANVVNPQGSRG